MDIKPVPGRLWRFRRIERVWLTVGLLALLLFGANVEQRTALRRTPMTDLGVFACAAGAVESGDNLYTITDWHGWHYQYPPALAILFTPLALPVPVAPVAIAAGAVRTAANTPWGYDIASHPHFFGLHAENARFFCIAAAWYLISVALIFLSTHALACALEKRSLRDPLPADSSERRRWWWLRTLPLLVCAGSLFTDLARGQVDILMLGAMCFGIYLAANRQDLKAGFWLSLPATVKIFPVLLLIYPVWRRRWRMICGAVAGLVFAIAIVPAIALGPTRSIDLYQDWFQMLAKPALGHGTDTSRTRELTGMAGTDNQSLLAFIHNWRYHDMPRAKRPPQAPPAERYAAYAIGALMLLGVVIAMGYRREDSPGDLLMSAGLLMGTALIVNPVSHNYYFLLLLPLVAGLLDRGLALPGVHSGNGKLLLVVAIFMGMDMAARFPVIGPWLRDCGFPCLSLCLMLAAGAMALRVPGTASTGFPQEKKPMQLRLQVGDVVR
jgi:hypothetical protein